MRSRKLPSLPGDHLNQDDEEVYRDERNFEVCDGLKESYDLILRTRSCLRIDPIESVLGEEASRVQDGDGVGDQKTRLEQIVDGEPHSLTLTTSVDELMATTRTRI